MERNLVCVNGVCGYEETFSNSEFGQIRIIMCEGKPWFVAEDVAECIEHKDASIMVRVCRDKDVARAKDKSRTLISESGLYRVIDKCRLPKCESFESWIFDEVLPSIGTKTTTMATAPAKSRMKTLVSNQLCLHNPISVKVHHATLSECVRFVYHLELTNYDRSIEEQFDNWDDLVRFIYGDAQEVFKDGSDIAGFKIWSEAVDFSDNI